MNRLVIGIAAVLGVILLLCIVLEKLGRGDLVKRAGERLGEKAGITASGFTADTNNVFTNEIERLLGASLRDIQKQPVEMQRIAKEKILAEIDRLKELQISAKGIELEADARTRENENRRKDLVALLDQAKAAVDDPGTAYPLQIGNFFYGSRKELLSRAADIRREADRLAAGNAKIMNVSPSAVKNARTIAKNIDDLENALDQLETIPLRANGARVDREVDAFRGKIRPWTSVPEQIETGIPDPRGGEDGSHDPTEEEDYLKAFGS